MSIPTRGSALNITLQSHAGKRSRKAAGSALDFLCANASAFTRQPSRLSLELRPVTELDPSARLVVDAMAAAGQPGLETLSSAEARAAFAIGMSMLQARPIEVGPIQDLVAETAHRAIPMRSYRPLSVDPQTPAPAIVFFHGGGFYLGDLEVFDRQCRRLCRAANCVVISVDYRLAPEHKFPAAPQDAFAALKWIAANAGRLAIDAERLAVAGDSAGGNLAAVVCLMAREAGAPTISHQTLIYPATNLSAEPIDGLFLTEAMMRHFLAVYMGSEADAKDWRASPALAESHAGLPPATVLVCGHDPLHDDGLAYSAALKSAGVPVQELRFSGQIHGFLLMDAAIPEAATAMDKIGRLIQSALKRSPR
ncbi:alpha/beta hydrolase [Nevskia ramosa]|uniref:alpha/beta hydrolase n=1 Tax=Nevskia ramosa TaxID=64002 RepID=UPI003D110FFA